MYASYGFGFLTTAYRLPLLLLDVSPLWVIIGLPTAQLIRQIPISFRYSRTAWLYLDRGFDPDVAEDAMLNRARFSWRTLPTWALRFSFQKVAVLHDIDECASLTGGERRRRRLAGDTGARNVIASTRWP